MAENIGLVDVCVTAGGDRLVKELGVGRDTIKEALKQLEREGLLESQGRRRQRRIAHIPAKARAKALRVRVLLYEDADRFSPYDLGILVELKNRGFAADFTRRSLQDFGMRVDRVAKFVDQTPADAWVVHSGSREILEWFARYQVPAIAVYGASTGLPIAAVSMRKTPAMRTALRRLVDLGHRRIVLLTREERRKPQPALFERNFLQAMTELGVRSGAYNLPDWEDSAPGLQRCLDELFAYTPPTALLLEDVQLLFPVQQYLARHKVLIPEQLSLIVNDIHPLFNWSDPVLAQMVGDYEQVVWRVGRWAENVAKGKVDHRQTVVEAAFIEGGTIGPVSP